MAIKKPLPSMVIWLLMVGVFFMLPVHPSQAQTQRDIAELTMRVDRLEAQIRELTGQIDRLTFALENQTKAPNPVAPPPLGAAPQPALPLDGGTAFSTSPANDASVARNSTARPTSTTDGFRLDGGGPLDLSALIAQGSGGSDQASQPTASFNTTVPQGAGVNQNPAVGAAAPANASALANGLGPRQAYDNAYSHVLRGDYDSAETQLTQFIQQYPGDPLVADAMFWLGDVQFVRGQFRDAATQFLETYSSYPTGAKAPDSLLKLGLSLKELGEREAACATYAELVRKYPTASPPVKDRVRQERRASDCI